MEQMTSARSLGNNLRRAMLCGLIICTIPLVGCRAKERVCPARIDTKGAAAAFPPLVRLATGVGSYDNTYHLTTEASLAHDASAIASNFATGVEDLPFKDHSGKLTLHYRKFIIDKSIERGAIVICNGRTESLLIYDELIFDLMKQNYSVYIMDHRGQGLSDRLLKDGRKGHVKVFDDYVADFAKFIDEIVLPQRHQNLYLLAHSMGGGIATRYLETPKAPMFKAVALVTPMHGPHVGFNTSLFCLGNALILPSRLTQYAVTTGPYNPAAFAANELTHSRIRYERVHAIYSKHCDNTIGGPTHAWVREACRAGKAMRKDLAVAAIRVPILVLQASDDTAVEAQAQDEFCKTVNERSKGGRCKGYVIEHAFHAVFIEADTFRVPALTKVLSFFENPSTL